MTPDQRSRARSHAADYPDTLISSLWRELVYVEELLESVCRYHPKFEDYRKAQAWRRKEREAVAGE